MILIKSIQRDPSTNDVIRWLLKLNAPFKRLNDTTNFHHLSFANNSFRFELDNGESIDGSELSAYWYRRGNYRHELQLPTTPNDEFQEKYNEYALAESKALGEFLTEFIKKNIPSIGDSLSCTFVNKNNILLSAKRNGLAVPDFLITTKKTELIAFQKKHATVITKPIHSSFIYGDDAHWLPTYTELVTPDVLEQMNENFQPTLFQQYIDKKIEIRSFYLDGAFYSMGIFSQNDDQTKVDFRKYNDRVPNRTVPFKLPDSIEQKLHTLMQTLQFESGSIDLIYSSDEQFYFLEVNPIGQFGMVSYPCNYQLERLIANRLAGKQAKNTNTKNTVS